MKNKHAPRSSKNNSGMATLEIVIALAIIILTLGGAVLVSFTNQTLLPDTQTEREALNIGEEMIQSASALARQDFKLLHSLPTSTNDIYFKNLIVTNTEYGSKKITAHVSWAKEANRTGTLSLDEIVTDFTNHENADTCSATLSGNWGFPVIQNSITDFATLLSDSNEQYPITDIDAFQGRLYITTNNSSSNKETFFILDPSDPKRPQLISKLDNDPANNTGLNALVVASSSRGVYAYVASASSFTKGQLQIIDVGSLVPKVVTTYKIPSNIVSGSSTQGTGKTIFYKNGLIYLGLSKTVSGPELNVIDVHDPLAPVWLGGYTVGNGINALYVKDGLVYLATPNTQELTVIDVSNPAHPIAVGGYDAPDSAGSGKSIFGVGNTIYFGRTNTVTHPEFYILDNTNPKGIPRNPLGTQEIGSSINDLIVRDFLTFFITTSGQFQIWNTSSTTHIVPFASPTLLSQNSAGVSMDCENNTFYVGSVPSSGTFARRGFLSIITSSP